MEENKKLLMLILLLALVLLVLTGCCNKRKNKSDIIKNQKGAMADTKVDMVKYLEPAAINHEQWGCGDYYSNISYHDMEAFLVKLRKEGWKNQNGEELCTSITEKTTQLTLTCGSSILQLVLNLKDKEKSFDNSILLHLDEEIIEPEVLNSKDAISKADALNIIQPIVDAMVKSNAIVPENQNITGLIEIFIKEAFGKMKLQAFSAVSNKGMIGNFLVCNGTALYVLSDLKETCITDIDGNGNYELLDLFGFGSGIYRIMLSAYEYGTWWLSSSMEKTIYRKYNNCFVPKNGFAELHLMKIDDTRVKLTGKDTEYGNLITDGEYLVPEHMDNFPFEEWRNTYGQSKPAPIKNKPPKEIPNITISIDGRSLYYITEAINWNGNGENSDIFDSKKTFEQIIKKGGLIPTYNVGGFPEEEGCRSIEFNFDAYMPDAISVDDRMLKDDGSMRYGDKTIADRPVEILDGSRAAIKLMQHFCYALSSNLEDYNKDWYRMFRVHCTWGDKKAVYTFIINTGKKEAVTEIEKKDLLVCGGTYSKLNSSWGINFSINDISNVLPKDYIIEWQINGGEIKAWSEKYHTPVTIADTHNGYPMTASDDGNNGAVIWAPSSFEEGNKAIIQIYIYRSAEDITPIACSKVVLSCSNMMWKEEVQQ